MRKIPNINTHIFKQPNIPWSAESWSVGDLANDDRTLLSEWDVSSTFNTIVTGMSNLKDLQGTNDFVQPTITKQPLLSGTGKSSLLTFDGVDDYLSQPITTDNFQNLIYFEYWTSALFDSTLRSSIVFQDNGIGSQVIHFQVQADNTILIYYLDGDFTKHSTTTTTAFSVGRHIIGFIADGIGYKIYVDGVEQSTVDAAAPDGRFIGGTTNPALYNITTIGSDSSGSVNYYNDKQQYGLAIGGLSIIAATTVAERTEIFNYINKRFDLGL